MAASDKSGRRSWMLLPKKDKSKDKDSERATEPASPETSNALHRSPSGSSFRRSFGRPTRSLSSQSIESATSSFVADTSSPYHISTTSASSSTSLTHSLQDTTHESERTITAPIPDAGTRQASNSTASDSSRLGTTSTGLGRLSLTSVLTLGLVREKSDDTERGRAIQKDTAPSSRRSSFGESERSRSRGRSTSPFRFRTRSRVRRDSSPSSVVEPLSLDADDDSVTGPRIRPRNAFSVQDDSSDDSSDGSEEEWSSDDDGMDELTAQHTEANAVLSNPFGTGNEGEVGEPDPLGEGVNVIIPSEPYFPSTQFSAPATVGPRSNVRRRRSTKVERDLLSMTTSRPAFSRDRCTITLVHGDPKRSFAETGRRGRKYFVASDMSEESRYAVEWGIGTVLRDGDELMLITVNENDSKMDPPSGSQVDRVAKLRSQQDRQTLAFLLVRQATGLLQRTKLHVTVVCQAWHAKNARHLLLDLIDYHNPTMVIVGSRGLTRLKGILLGSTSHYLIQKSSVPVMVARRRLKRPAKKAAHLAPHRARVSLAEAAIDKVGPGKVDKDVEVLRDELQRDEAREAVDLRLAGADRGIAEDDEDNTAPAHDEQGH